MRTNSFEDGLYSPIQCIKSFNLALLCCFDFLTARNQVRSFSVTIGSSLQKNRCAVEIWRSGSNSSSSSSFRVSPGTLCWPDRPIQCITRSYRIFGNDIDSCCQNDVKAGGSLLQNLRTPFDYYFGSCPLYTRSLSRNFESTAATFSLTCYTDWMKSRLHMHPPCSLCTQGTIQRA